MKISDKFELFLRRVDKMAPDPWIVEGYVQARPVTQLGIMIGVIIGFIICIILFV